MYFIDPYVVNVSPSTADILVALFVAFLVFCLGLAVLALIFYEEPDHDDSWGDFF